MANDCCCASSDCREKKKKKHKEAQLVTVSLNDRDSITGRNTRNNMYHTNTSEVL